MVRFFRRLFSVLVWASLLVSLLAPAAIPTKTVYADDASPSAAPETETPVTSPTPTPTPAPTPQLPKADLRVHKDNSLNSNPGTVGNSFKWNIVINNNGAAPANFSDGEVIFKDQMPGSGVLDYGDVQVETSGVSGSVNCLQEGSKRQDLGCLANGAVHILPGGRIGLQVTVYPTEVKTLNNPRLGGDCLVDPENVISESDESNNVCADAVTIQADTEAPSAPGTPITATPSNNNLPTWTWSSASDNVRVNHYVFYWDTVPGGQANSSGDIPASQLTYSHLAALTDGIWYGKVTAFDHAGNSTSSGNGTVNIDTTAPDIPVASPPAGSFGSSQSVSLTSNDSGTGVMAIYYTLDNSEPSSQSGSLYTGPILVDHSLTLKAIAYDFVSNASPVLTAEYVITPAGSPAPPGGNSTTPPAPASPPVCTDTKPGSSPTLVSAAPGLNSVTLTWTEGLDPISYYLITYGTSSGAQTWGNPNVGGKGTISYTVGGLSGGVVYYFRIRAGNGCTPGDYSNEVSAAPFGGFLGGTGTGFLPGVLGSAENLSTGIATESGSVLSTESGQPTPPPQNQAASSGWETLLRWLLLLVALILGYLVYRRRKQVPPGQP